MSSTIVQKITIKVLHFFVVDASSFFVIFPLISFFIMCKFATILFMSTDSPQKLVPLVCTSTRLQERSLRSSFWCLSRSQLLFCISSFAVRMICDLHHLYPNIFDTILFGFMKKKKEKVTSEFLSYLFCFVMSILSSTLSLQYDFITSSSIGEVTIHNSYWQNLLSSLFDLRSFKA